MKTYPAQINTDHELLAQCVKHAWVRSGVQRAPTRAERNGRRLTKCIHQLDCADICATTGAALSRHTGYDANVTRSFLEACATACKACADECEQHASMHEHCRICAEACLRCEDACNRVLSAIG